MFLFIFEGLGTSELLLILVVALVIFGPRKLPQLSRSLGKSLADFRRASEDFKQTWEKEVAREGAFKEALLGEAMLPPEDHSILGEGRDRTQSILDASSDAYASDDAPAQDGSSARLEPSADAMSVARGRSTAPASAAPDAPETPEPARKRDWL